MKTFRIFALLTVFFLSLIIAIWSISGKNLFYEEFGNSTFETDKQEIINLLHEELTYMSNTEEKNKLKHIITLLEKEKDEHRFFEQLDATFHEKEIPNEEILSQEEKKKTIQHIEIEIGQIKNTEVSSKARKLFDTLSTENDENTFLETLETIYNLLDSYYESENITPDWATKEIEFDEKKEGSLDTNL